MAAVIVVAIAVGFVVAAVDEPRQLRSDEPDTPLCGRFADRDDNCYGPCYETKAAKLHGFDCETKP